MILSGPGECEALGRRIGALVQPGDIVALSGTLGAGKTTMARGILHGLGYSGEVASPSFAIVHHYEPPDVGVATAHADLYRLEGETEWQELGLDEWLEDGALLVEWPENGPDWLRAESLHLMLAHAPDVGRRLTVAVSPAWKNRWPIP